VPHICPLLADVGFHPPPTTTPETQVPQSGTTVKAVACPERVGASRRVERGLQAGEPELEKKRPLGPDPRVGRGFHSEPENSVLYQGTTLVVPPKLTN
jgi:hypothetical protein